MFLNVIKGSGLTMNQVDKSLLVSASETGVIQRGTAMYVDENNEWRIAGATQAGSETVAGAVIYFALQPSTDLTAQAAGGVPANGSVQAKVTGLACTSALELELDMFTGELDGTMLLSVGANGRLVEHTDGATAVARCTAEPYVRWANDAVAVAGWRTGANVTVIRALTMYAPQIAAE